MAVFPLPGVPPSATPGLSMAIVSQYTLLLNGQPIGTLQDIAVGDPDGESNVSGAQVVLDTTAAQMGQCTFSCLDPTGTLTPTGNNGGQLMPTGVEVSIQMGYLFGGTPILWPVGVFGVEEVAAATGSGTNASTGAGTDPGPVLSVTGFDRSARIAANLFEDSFSFGPCSVTSAVEQILAAQAPWALAGANIQPSDVTIAAQALQPGADPWQAVVAVCASGGAISYFDPSGLLVVRPAPAGPGSASALMLSPGVGGVAVDMTHSVNNQPGYNGVIVTGSSLSSTSPPVSGVAWDMDPTSPTYAFGPYGKRPAPPVTVSTATSGGQCTTIAESILPQVLGLTRQLAADCLPVPFLWAYDLIQANCGPIGLSNVTYIAQQLTIPLDYSGLEAIIAVPVGAPLSQLVALPNGPSPAALAPIPLDPVGYSGGAAFTRAGFSQIGVAPGPVGGTSSVGPPPFSARTDIIAALQAQGVTLLWAGGGFWNFSMPTGTWGRTTGITGEGPR